MKSILHIGLSKTGTTSLQRTLRHSGDYLCSCRVLYPESPEPLFRHNHAPLAGLITPFDKLRRKLRKVFDSQAGFDQALRCYIDALKSQIEHCKPACLVLSAEQLGKSIQRAGAASTIRSLCGNDLTVVMYVRRPSERCLSRLAEHFKAAHDVPRLRFGALNILESYEKTFGAGTVDVRVFDWGTLAGGDIVSDFTATYLAPFGVQERRLSRVDRRNAVLSAESMAIMQRYRRDFHGEELHRHHPDSEALARALGRADRVAGAPRPAFRPGVADRIDYATTEVLRLRDRTGAVFPDFDYQRLEQGRLEPPLPECTTLDELVHIDPEKQRRIASIVRQTDWATGDPGRIDWLRRRFG